MKLIFKTIFLVMITLQCISSTVLCRDIVLIENRGPMETGVLLKTILMDKYHFPANIITLRATGQDCQKKSDSIIHLCIDKNGELEIKKINEFIVQNSLSVFLNQSDKKSGEENEIR